MKMIPLGWCLAALALAGCGGPDLQAMCEEAENCVGGNDADIDACVAESELYVDLLDDIGCSDEYSEYFDCIEAASTCHDQQLGGNCMSTSDCGGVDGVRCQNGSCVLKSYGPSDSDACDVEQRTLNRCSDLD